MAANGPECACRNGQRRYLRAERSVLPKGQARIPAGDGPFDEQAHLGRCVAPRVTPGVRAQDEIRVFTCNPDSVTGRSHAIEERCDFLR